MNREQQTQLSNELIGIVSDAIRDKKIDLAQENIQDFMFALSTLLPLYFHNKFTGEEKNILEYNHIVNNLILRNEIEIQSDNK